MSKEKKFKEAEDNGLYTLLPTEKITKIKYPIYDDLEDLKRRYTPEQLQKMWEDWYPKSSKISGKVIITGTPKLSNK